MARLIKGPRLSGVTVTWSCCCEDILVFLQLLAFSNRIHEGGGGGGVGRGADRYVIEVAEFFFFFKVWTDT